MFIGRYYHTLEEKGRLSLPKAFREQEQEWVVTRGLDGGLFLFPKATFQGQVEVVAGKPFTKKNHRDFIRLMLNEAKEVTTDGNGRIQLPDYLQQFAKLTKDVVVVGSNSYLEIWSREAYHAYLDEIEKQAEQISESLYDAPTST